MLARARARVLCTLNRGNNNRFYTTAANATPATQENEIIETKKGSAAFITLNRPQSLNALNLNMVRLLTPKYKAWHSHPNGSPFVVVMKGAGGKAFCAGGDIRAMYDLGKAWHASASSSSPSTSGIEKHATEFFREEYTLNYLIATLPQPHVALLNGITMGGGVGLSVHGTFRVATENTTFAMPETGIGFFCDVGGSYFLPRLRDGLGLYLGLTGNRLKGGAVMQAGIATHYVPSAQLDALQEALTTVQAPNQTSVVKSILDSFAVAPPAQDSIQHLEAIACCFGSHHNTLASVFAALQAEDRQSLKAEDNQSLKAEDRQSLKAADRQWAKDTLKALARASPTSLHVVFRELREGAKKKNIAECLQLEYRLADAFLRPSGPSRDFFEGVRATLVDKDKNYKWNPDDLTKINEEYVRPFFEQAPTGGDLVL